MADELPKEWTLQVLAHECGRDEEALTPEGTLSGKPKGIDFGDLLNALTQMADVTGERLNSLEVSPTEFTVEGHVSLQVSAGVGPVLQFGAEGGISVSMTWRFEHSTTTMVPCSVRRVSPPPKEPPPPTVAD
jgi:hypothetical protein